MTAAAASEKSGGRSIRFFEPARNRREIIITIIVAVHARIVPRCGNRSHSGDRRLSFGFFYPAIVRPIIVIFLPDIVFRSRMSGQVNALIRIRRLTSTITTSTSLSRTYDMYVCEYCSVTSRTKRCTRQTVVRKRSENTRRRRQKAICRTKNVALYIHTHTRGNKDAENRTRTQPFRRTRWRIFFKYLLLPPGRRARLSPVSLGYLFFFIAPRREFYRTEQTKQSVQR